jgi:hypothetical protein
LAAEKKSFLLRIDPQLWAALEKLAASELRSVNGQIEFLLRDAVAKRGVNIGESGSGNSSNSGNSKSTGGSDA